MKHIIFPILMLLSSQVFAYTDTQIHQAKEEIVKLSVMSYSGNCPCPYSSTNKGMMCGKRSAYSPQARGPKCFAQDVSDSEAIQYLKKRN